MKPYYEEDGITIYHGDCVTSLLGAELVGVADATITDPPYNVGTKYDGYDDAMSAEDYADWLKWVFTLTAAVAPTLVYTPGVVNVFGVADVLTHTTFRPIRLLGWHRKEFAGDRWSGGPAMSWEPIVWASTADQPFYNRSFGHTGRDFLVVNSTHGNPWFQHHPCPKPIDVFKWLIGLFVPEGGTLFDPFAGSGTSLEAARLMGRKAIGIEKSERYCEVIVKRLAQGVLAL